ncbi:MAG: hypothetical protein HYZ45_10245 [Burkholderiales bacterium]|nr:hypothetical protein [Burkholderiales bacterium]
MTPASRTSFFFKLVLPGIVLCVLGSVVFNLVQNDELLTTLKNLRDHQNSFQIRLSEEAGQDNNGIGAHGELRLVAHGKLGFSSDETSVASLSDNATIEEKRGSQYWRVDFSLDENKHIVQNFSYNGRQHAADAQARRWLAGVIPILLRESGNHAKTRVASLLTRGGADMVLNEIDLIRSSHSRAKYGIALVSQVQLEPKQIQRLLAFTSKMNDSYETSRLLKAVITKQNLDASSQVELLKQSANIQSDFEHAALLQHAMPKLVDNDTVLQAWLGSIQTIESDFEIRHTIEAIGGRDATSEALIATALQASNQINSDFERRSALEFLAGHIQHNEPKLIQAYLASCKGIDSDFERRSALVTIINGTTLANAEWSAVFDAMQGMGSDFEVREVLQTIAKHLPNDPQLQQRYHKTAAQLGDFERDKAERALLARQT